VGSSEAEVDRKLAHARRIRGSAIPDHELPDNLALYLTRQTLSRVNFMQMLYAQILPVHGSIFEFGVRWGQNLALFSMLRGMHEPYNHNRRIIGFDTFGGFPSVSEQDGKKVKEGDYSVEAGWKQELEGILDFHEQNAPIPHKKKYELVQGDASQTLPAYLKQHPETVIALAYFDFDLYRPTKDCLEAIMPHVTRGTVLAFDELNCAEFPGETLALREVLGLSAHALRRDPNTPLASYLVI
jgi:hypothetical protein